jgi:hypothetical protein
MKPKTSTTTSQKPARRVTPGPQTPSVSVDLYEQIARRAHEIYVRRIRQGALDDWLQTEREILRQKKTQNPDMSHRGGYAAPEQE